MRKSFGSYFSLEIPTRIKNYYYPDAIRLNTARNALEYLIEAFNIKKIYLPYLLCDALYTPIKRKGISYDFYNIDQNFNPVYNLSELEQDSYFLYINYYGIKNSKVKDLAINIPNLIIDNSQAFFCEPEKSVPTFYSLRKFFGVADGALLLNSAKVLKLTKDKSAHRMKYLIERLENEVEYAYDEYRKTEKELDNVRILEMSEVTENIFSGIDFLAHKKARNVNFEFLDGKFKKFNEININDYEGSLAYPLLVNNGGEIKNKLRQDRIYLPTYWPNVLDTVNKNSHEYYLSENTIPIPVDLRYHYEDLDYVSEKIISLL